MLQCTKIREQAVAGPLGPRSVACIPTSRYEKARRWAGPHRRLALKEAQRRAIEIAELLRKNKTHIYVCGLRGLEEGAEAALTDISREHGIDWSTRRSELRRTG